MTERTPLSRREIEAIVDSIRRRTVQLRQQMLADADRDGHFVHRSGRGPWGWLRFVAHTDGHEHSHVILDGSGVDLRRYHANPIVLWNHDNASLPVGRARVHVDDEARLIADIRFDRRDRLGRELARKYRRGFLSAVSIDYDPLDLRIDDEDRFLVTRWSLVELSAVTVPANPEAVRARNPKAGSWRRRGEPVGR